MIPLSIKQAVQIVDGQLQFIQDENCLIQSVSTDTRKITSGCLFVALTGERFDGHDFVEQAMQSGACAVVVDHAINKPIAQIIVKDTHQALGQLAGWVRSQSNARVVALTGSSGKTSVKEMTAAILKQCGQTHYTQGNLNNEIGVPLTLLQLTKQDQFAVIELGANHIGEIAYTTGLTQPESALINNIAAAHLEGFGSLEGVAKAKGEIFLGLPKQGGIAIINADCHSRLWQQELSKHQVYTFSLQSDKADYYATDIVESDKTTFVLHTPQTQFTVQLPLMGLHNVANALAATALAMSVGASEADVQQGLDSLKPVKGRLFPIQLTVTQRLFDDTYNANVSSMLAAVAVLEKQPGYRVLVVGDMGELGQEAQACHQQIGEAAKAAKLDCVLSVGQLSQYISQCSGVGQHLATKEDVSKQLKQLLAQHPVMTILVKGSRSAGMEQIIAQLV